MRHRKRKKAAARTLAMTVVVVAALAALTVLAFSRVFIVRDVMVVGNRTLLKEEVVAQSGVKPGDRYLAITPGKLRQRLEANRYIEYLGHDFDYRGTLTIRINERLGMAVVSALGLYYVIDDSGMVLECTGNEYPVDVAGPRVTNLSLDEGARIVVGDMLPVHDGAQMQEMENILTELDEVGLLARASELNMKNADNLYVMTQEGAKIELGDAQGLRVKLLIAREVLIAREEAGDLQGAKIDVSNGQNAHYIPAILPTPTAVPTPTPGPEATESPKP